jgi:type IX secretion system PorP/SprF family membrane protein
MAKIKQRYLSIAFCWVAFMGIQESQAQRNPVFTQYMFNGLILNPAYTGSQDALMLTASIRSQWSGLEGAPQTQVFSAHSPVKFTRSGAGFVAIHDKAGALSQTTVYGTYSYRIPVSANGKISVGMQAGGTFNQANLSSLNVVTQNNNPDLAFSSNEIHVLPNLGIGVYYYTKKTYVGFSLTSIIDNRWNNNNQLQSISQQRHYYMTAGYVFDLNADLKLKPNILLKFVEGGPFQYDINANLFIKNIVWVGVSYRMQDSIDLLFEWNINDQLAFGYSFGYPTSALAAVQTGTHEIVINYRMKRDNHIIRSPRYF